MRARDVSNYTPALSQEVLAGWKAEDVGLVIVQSVDPARPYPRTETAQQIQACVEAGMPVDVYVYQWFGRLDLVQDALALIAPFAGKIRKLWLDVEDTSPFAPSARVAEIRQALGFLDAFGAEEPAGIYTAHWYWPVYTANTWDFMDRDLWVSEYDGDPDTSNFTWFGGWAEARVKQYRGTSTDGVGNIDLDSVSDPEAAQVVAETSPPTPRDTPADYPYPDWRQSAIAYRGALDEMGRELAACKGATA